MPVALVISSALPAFCSISAISPCCASNISRRKNSTRKPYISRTRSSINCEQAAAYLQKSLDIAQQIGHPWLVCETRCVLAELHLKQEQVDTARDLFQDAFDKALALGAQELVATALFGLARVAHACADDCEARQLAQKSSTVFLAMGHGKERAIAAWLSALPAS